ncbi:MAG: phenylalanine--tRNA ligase subunit alpha [Myxococcota bacterium]
MAEEGPSPLALDRAERSFAEALTTASDLDALHTVRSQFFGPKGQLTLMLRSVGRLPPEERREAGQKTNEVKRRLEAELEARIEEETARRKEAELRRERLDLTLPGRRPVPVGGTHPTIRTMEKMVDIFTGMGFSLADGPEVETDWYNFEALNFPPNHPARDMQDTFFVKGRGLAEPDLVLRTHTSPVQIRVLEAHGAPVRIIAPGRVFRCDSDATHSPSFFQVEGLLVDEGVSMAHLKGVLQSFINQMFGERPARFRPSFFPFVEPGVEVDMQCARCDGAGCRLCKMTGWMEILGAGMVHPNVLEACKVDAERYTGFAFGLGVDRVAMIRHAVDDLGHLFRSDIRVLEQLGSD